jgi:hypothetical protein
MVVMMEIIEAGAAFLLMIASALTGWAVQRALSDRHRTRDNIESVRLVITMLVTFSALMLGLLTSSAKSRFDREADALSSYSVSLIELDQRMRQFGPETAPMRAALRTYVAAAIADTWRDETPPTGTYPRFPANDPETVENRSLGALLIDIEAQIDMLQFTDARQRSIGPRLRLQIERVLDERWHVVASVKSTISWPFLAMLLFWMTIIFSTFGLSSPRSPTIYVTIFLCALLIASSLYLILDYDSPKTGFIHLFSMPLRNALAHIDATD